jgi:hypothetical protein
MNDQVSVVPGASIASRSTTRGGSSHAIRGFNLNPWCRIPGSPFVPGLFLPPSVVPGEETAVTFGPFDVHRDVDTFSFLFGTQERQAHGNRVRVSLGLLDDGEVLAESAFSLPCAGREALTLTVTPGERRKLYLHIAVSYAELNDPSIPCGVTLPHLVGYRANPLVRLFNSVGSDKGTEFHCGGGAPHCYAIQYFELLQDLRESAFDLLEIGLDNESARTGRPTDAPSLRAWRQFFPAATLFGIDINDFSAFQQERTIVHRADQSSRDDLEGFLALYGERGFRVIIDDGSHASSHQQISLATLFPALEPGGLYFIEDLFWQPFEESPTTLQALREFVETGRFDSPFVSPAEASYLEANIESVRIFKPNDSEFAVLRKRS